MPLAEESFHRFGGQMGRSPSRDMTIPQEGSTLPEVRLIGRTSVYRVYPVYLRLSPSGRSRTLPDPLHSAAVKLLQKAADRAARRGNVPFALPFVRSSDRTSKPPLARLVQGGRGGEVRLKLYLCITMMATAAPYDIRLPPTPQSWARMLALPPDTGPRRINSNLRWLNDNGYIQLMPRPGKPPSIRLLSVWAPKEKFVRASEHTRYLGVPIEFWTNGWILHLSATGIALLFVLLEALGGHEKPQYIPQDRRDSYGLSHNTWTKARKELENYQLLTVRRTPQGGFFDYRLLRNAYWVDKHRLFDKP